MLLLLFRSFLLKISSCKLYSEINIILSIAWYWPISLSCKIQSIIPLLLLLASNASAGSQPRVSLVCTIVVDHLVDPADLIGVFGADLQSNSISKIQFWHNFFAVIAQPSDLAASRHARIHTHYHFSRIPYPVGKVAIQRLVYLLSQANRSINSLWKASFYCSSTRQNVFIFNSLMNASASNQPRISLSMRHCGWLLGRSSGFNKDFRCCYSCKTNSIFVPI